MSASKKKRKKRNMYELKNLLNKLGTWNVFLSVN